jgi:hypothetical protein
LSGLMARGVVWEKYGMMWRTTWLVCGVVKVTLPRSD